MCIPLNWFCCPRSTQQNDIEIDIVETPKSISDAKNKFKTMDIKIDGKAQKVLKGQVRIKSL